MTAKNPGKISLTPVNSKTTAQTNLRDFLATLGQDDAPTLRIDEVIETEEYQDLNYKYYDLLKNINVVNKAVFYSNNATLDVAQVLTCYNRILQHLEEH